MILDPSRGNAKYRFEGEITADNIKVKIYNIFIDLCK